MEIEIYKLLSEDKGNEHEKLDLAKSIASILRNFNLRSDSEYTISLLQFRKNHLSVMEVHKILNLGTKERLHYLYKHYIQNWDSLTPIREEHKKELEKLTVHGVCMQLMR